MASYFPHHTKKKDPTYVTGVSVANANDESQNFYYASRDELLFLQRGDFFPPDIFLLLLSDTIIVFFFAMSFYLLLPL